MMNRRGMVAPEVEWPASSGPVSGSEQHTAMLASIKPRFASAIMDGSKKVEFRRRSPRWLPPTMVVYGSGKMGSVLGSVEILNKTIDRPEAIWDRYGNASAMSREEFDSYFSGSEIAVALELGSVKTARRTIELDRLREMGLEPPQSWRYVSAHRYSELMEATWTVVAVD